MQLPTVDRSPNLRPAGADMVVSAGPKVVPVAPVNPSVQVSASVVNKISAELQAKVAEIAEAVQVSAPDPLKGGAKTDSSNKDWTERNPPPEKVTQAPPKESISKMLIEHMHSIWAASAKAVEVILMNNPNPAQTQARVQNLNQMRSQDSAAVPGVVAREELTYSPSKVKKTEKT